MKTKIEMEKELIWEYKEPLLSEVAEKICQLFPKSEDNPDGYEPCKHEQAEIKKLKDIHVIKHQQEINELLQRIGKAPKPESRLLTDEEIDKVWRETESALGFPMAEPLDNRGLPDYAGGKDHLEAIAKAQLAKCKGDHEIDLQMQAEELIGKCRQKIDGLIREIETGIPDSLRDNLDWWKNIKAEYTKKEV